MIHFTTEVKDLKGKIALISAISAGEIPTKTLDYLIQKNKFKRIGYIETDYLIPSVGYLHENIQGGALGLPAEIYLQGDVVIFQFRSSLRFARKKDFSTSIKKLLKEQGIEQTWVISSLPLSQRADIQISSDKRNIYYCSKGVEDFSTKIANLLPLSKLRDEDEEDSQLLTYGGIAKQFIEEEKTAILFLFGNRLDEKQILVYYGENIARIIDRKELHLI